MRTRAKFKVFPQIKDGEKKWYWNLHAGNSQVILSSYVHDTRRSAIVSTLSVRFTRRNTPRFHIYKVEEKWHFDIVSMRNKPLGVSQGYTTKHGAMNGVQSIVRHSSFARLEVRNG